MSISVVRAGWVTWHLNNFPWSALFRLNRRLDTVFPAPNKKISRYLFHEIVYTLFARSYTVNCFVWVSAKFGTCTVVSVNETLVEEKMRRFKGEYAHFSCNKCLIYTLDSASAKFSTNSHECMNCILGILNIKPIYSYCAGDKVILGK
jgi:hypothetical protein